MISEAQSPRIVAFGASAGGLQALRPIINRLPRDGQHAYLVAHHLSPVHPTSLAELLGAQSQLTVVVATDHGVPLPDHVYVCPPGCDIELVDGRLSVTPSDPNGAIAPSIDRLFRSLAACRGEKAIVVILSGSGSDGVQGAEAVNSVDGMVLVQLPEEAVQPGMPQAAIHAGFADLIGGTDEIVKWISQSDNPDATPDPLADDEANQTFASIFRMVAEATGLDLGQYKESTLRRQTLRRSRCLGLDTLGQYLGYLKTHPEELQPLQQSYMISVSSFFRDAEAFQALAKALRKQIAGKRQGDSIRVWVPACATGEEAYSIAILLSEILGERQAQFDVRIFATDIDQRALDVARAGVYTSSDLGHLDPARRQRWFSADGSGWRIDKTVRERCVFSLHDVIAHPPFIKMDLISCRNLLIYFKNEQQAELIHTFHYGLNQDGLLLLGKSEAAGFNSRLFEAIDGSQKLYRRRNGVAAYPARHARFGLPTQVSRPHLTSIAVNPQRQTLVDASLATIAREYGPPGVLVNASFEPLHFFGRSQRYFSLPSDDADFSVFSLCLPNLRSELKALAYRFIQENLERLEGVGIDLQVEGEYLRIRPVLRRVTQAESDDFAFLITFEEVLLAADLLPSVRVECQDAQRSEEIVRLRQELGNSREQLQAVIEELEASNEELQSLNEEVQSSSEELQSSNEELQSSNEELTTLNDELRIKSLEAAQLSTTLSNIQNSIRTSLVVIDHEGRITRYNGLATRIFGLVANDIGQFIYGIPCHLQLPDLRQQVSGVVASGESLVEQVRQGDFHYLMQIDPYRNELGENAGAVLTFSDISDIDRAEQAQHDSEIRFSRVWEACLEGLLVANAAGVIVMANPALESMFGYAKGALLGKALETLVPDALRRQHVEYRQTLSASAEIRRADRLIRNLRGLRADGREIFVEVSLSGMEVNGESYVLASTSDVTERKLAEDALRDREYKLGAIIGNSPSALSLKTADGRYALANPNLQRIHHLSEAEIVGKTDFELYPESVARAFCANDQLVLQSAERHSIEEVMPVDGCLRTFMSHIFPIFGENQAVQFICRISLDITERKAAELALRQSEQRLRLAQDAAKAGAWEWTVGTNENFWSDEIWKLYGQTPHSVPANFDSWLDTVDPDDREKVVKEIGEAVAGASEFEIEWRVLLPEDVPPRFLMSRGRPILGKDGRPEQYIGIVLDITERKLAEAELEQHRSKLEMMVAERTHELSELYNRAPCGYHSLDNSGYFINVNDTELEWLGYSRDELLGRMRAIDIMSAESRAIFRDNFPKLISDGELSGLEFDMVRKDGSLMPALLHAKAVFDENGKFIHSLSTILDNSARKRAEKAWIAAREAADSANRAKSTFLANMSHEIRTPLNAIIGLGHVMKRGAAAPEQAEQLTKIDAAAQHLLAVINDILDLSKIEADKLDLEDIAFDLPQLTASVVAMLQGRVASKGLELRVECDAFAEQLRGDPTRFTQAFLNLAGNAVKFTEHGFVTLRVLRQQESAEKVLVRVEVEDSGAGIPAAVLARLFTPFEQGESSSARRFGGTGLGLTITRRLAEMMGGEAGVSSTMGRGSIFWFTAWLSRTGAAQAEPSAFLNAGTEEEVLRRKFHGSKVLLVEDEPVNQEVAQMFLNDIGFSVSIANNGLEALDLAAQGDFDLVLMDIQMPEMDGLEAARQIRRLAGWAKVPIVAMTANAFAEDRERCILAGMNDFLPKPFNPDKFFSTLLHWLTRRA